MFRKIIAGTAVAGALTLGLAGAAGATAGTTGTHTGAAPGDHPVDHGVFTHPQIQARVQKVESQARTELTKAQAAEAKAKAAGPHQVGRPHRRSGSPRARTRETKVNARLVEASSECGSSATAG